jgi:anti-anti-sigma factor
VAEKQIMPSGRDAATSAPRLVIAGRVDINRARALHQEVCALWDQGRELSIDWSEVEVLDAAGLQILLALHVAMKAAERRLTVSAPSAAVAQTLALAGLTQVFSEEAALP